MIVLGRVSLLTRGPTVQDFSESPKDCVAGNIYPRLGCPIPSV